MTETQPTASQAQLAPLSQPERIVSLDVLRGFALLGILVMNVQSFSMIAAAYFNPTAYGDLSGANFWAWLLSHILTDQKFMAIFSMLFGAGIVLMSERLQARGASPTGLHYRRMFWLIVFGLLHAHLLWYGDVLYFYGMCGLFVFLFRKLSPRKLMVLGLLLLAIGSGIFLLTGWSMQFWPQEAVTQFNLESWKPPADRVAQELAIYRGGWLDQMERRVPMSLGLETMVFLFWGLWRAAGMMLIGMALFKLGVFSAVKPAAFYRTMILCAVLIGIPLVLYGVYRHFESGWDVRYSFFLGSQFNYWASIVVSLGWVGLIMLLCQRGRAGWFTARLAAVGQTAFTNYLLQTLICTTIFYGHGLGMFGHVSRLGQMGIVVAVWLVQLTISPIWLRHFRFGPFEWLWRSLTYLRFQAMRVKA